MFANINKQDKTINIEKSNIDVLCNPTIEQITAKHKIAETKKIAGIFLKKIINKVTIATATKAHIIKSITAIGPFRVNANK